MRFIFGDDDNDALGSPRYLDFRLFTSVLINSETNRRKRYKE